MPRLLTRGAGSLTHAELLALLLGSGTKNVTAVELARQILMQSGNSLHELGRQNINDLIKIRGIGPAKGITLLAALELGRRREATKQIEKTPVKSSENVFRFFHPLLGDLEHEEFWLLLLNRANRILGRFKVSQGGLSGTVIDTRIILKKALDNLASSIIVCHNHPSGNNNPRQADIQLTRKLSDAGKTLDIPVLDHIIIAGTKYYSFADEGMM